MRTLIEILAGGLSYDSSWAVYAEKIDGKFQPESPARFGQDCFENGGILDDCEKFGNNDWISDQMEDWYGGFDLRENSHARTDDGSIVETRLTVLWAKAHRGVETPGIQYVCEWAKDIADGTWDDRYEDDPLSDDEFKGIKAEVEELIEWAERYYQDNLDSDNAIDQVIALVNEGV